MAKKKNLTRLPQDPFIRGDTMYVPVDGNLDGGALMEPEEFMRQSHKLSDKELNRILYGQAQALVRAGAMPDWPEDDFGAVFWFTWNFITPEMREVFPAIAREYLSHEPMIGTEFLNVPYPFMNETTWDDAYYYRVIALMLFAARKGSSYSRNFLISLYRVYYKQEYNKLKAKRIVTWLDVLELHDEDCRRKGYSSGHTLNGGKSFRDSVIEQRLHQAGWTNVYGARSLDPVPKTNYEELQDAARLIRNMSDAPDEPPLQPTSSRVFIMAELLRIPIDPTCNQEAWQMNEATESMTKLDFLTSPEFREAREFLVERGVEFISADRPETTDPYLYQSDTRYFALEVAEDVMYSAFRNNDRNPRLPYDSRPFRLNELLAEVMLILHVDFPELEPATSDALLLAQILYLSECLCDLMVTRDSQLDEILHFHRRYAEGEKNQEAEAEKRDVKADKVLKTVAKLREVKEEETAEEPEGEEETGAEVSRLRAELEEKELALAEAEQKTIQQRALYEKARDSEAALKDRIEKADAEHAELIALREYVYSLRDESETELDEATREQMVAAVQDKNVAVLGGTERWVKRMRKLYPKWKFVSVEDDSQGAMGALESADFIYVYTSALQHKQYYKAMDIVRRKGKMLFYLGSTNTNENVIRFHRDLCR